MCSEMHPPGGLNQKNNVCYYSSAVRMVFFYFRRLDENDRFFLICFENEVYMKTPFDLTYLREQWKPAVGDKEAERRVWDRNAETYRERPLPKPETDLSMRCVYENDMVCESSYVLDIGCGGGIYSVPLARMAAHLVGTDVSPCMLEIARNNAARYGVTNAEFHLIDWHSFELPDAWKKHFDLVFANLTPAIQSYHTLDLMNRASGRWCFLSKPVEWKNSLIYEAVEHIGLWDEYRTFDEDMLYAYSILRLEGYTPYTAYQKTKWHSVSSVENAIRDVTERINMKNRLTEEQQRQIHDFVELHAVDGQVETTTDVLYAAYYWRVDDR